MFDESPKRKATDTWNIAIKATIGMLLVIGTMALCATSSKENNEIPAAPVAAPE
ncbi:hypothetical protein [Mesorhizobium sp. SP-1A]|uniref:hypothetical protein n=1 Tax=Mesorhizobium sp. SP-1A TaxID=3077840 RepID=UPI0028F6EF4B|nr:hypothetical protein [Mesorhizobium sp. SP-1A]